MNIWNPVRILIVPLIAVASLAFINVPALADDTEVFEITANTNIDARPKVLILFDDSGSMGTTVTGQRPPYDPTRNDYAGGISGSEFDRVYWSTNGTPPAANSNQWFDVAVNRCASSYAGLDNQGSFSSQGTRRWRNSSTGTSNCGNCSIGGSIYNVPGWICGWFGGTVIPYQCTPTTSPGDWGALSTSVHSPDHVECEEDVINSNSDNGSGQIAGYPVQNVPDGQEYSGLTPGDSDADWGNQSYTLYSANFIDYWNDNSLIVNSTRLEIAQTVIADLVAANTGVDFGLATFNRNSVGHDGGRIVQRIIKDMDGADRTNLVTIVNGLDDDGATPLCESYSEVFRYLTGAGVWYGDDRDTSGSPDRDLPARDTAAESSGTYISPLEDCQYVYVILMTDGLPSNDSAANTYIEGLTGETCSNWANDNNSGPSSSKNCLPELAEYMATTDLDNDPSNDEQFAITYTIGFAAAGNTTLAPLLNETATRGGGEYFGATSYDTLYTAFNDALLGILSSESTFTSPAVAVDSFSRTQSRDDIFYAMFKPNQRADWRGNIKKLKLFIDSDGVASIVDKNGTAAIETSTNAIKDDIDSYWSTNDGGFVEQGGVGGLLAVRDPATRTIYSNLGTSSTMPLFNSANVTPTALGVATTADMYAYFGVSGAAHLSSVLAYAQGYEVTNGVSTGVVREWVMGDPLHSQPLILNYGARSGFSVSSPDLRILVGTNAGFFHMFGDSDGVEDWAFFPKELASILNQRLLNQVTQNNIYGLDLTPEAYTVDVNKDGTLSSADGDTAWLYQGMRRGGRSLYALNISNPDTPSFLFLKSFTQTGFSELGLTWSQPSVTKIPGYVDGSGVPKPVVIMGGGYDLSKDSSGIATPDSMGRGVFIIDAQTGALVRSITPAARTDTNLQEVGLEHSVPGEIALLDSNSDDLTDRLYFSDAGGHVWRVDIALGLPDFDAGETWRIVKLADLNDAAVSPAEPAEDRRFFSKPDIVRIRLSTGQAVDALLIGSGDRSNPLGADVTNFFYMLRDVQVTPYVTAVPTPTECASITPHPDNRCSLPIGSPALFDITDNVLNDGTVAEKDAALLALAASSGWKLELEGTGEKSLSDSVTLGGTVIFTTFTPNSVAQNAISCEPRSGEGKLYLVDIYGGERTILSLGPIVPDTPSVHVDGDGNYRLLLPPSDSSDPNNPTGLGGGIYNPGKNYPLPYANFWYRAE